jgi:hypothetical protein
VPFQRLGEVGGTDISVRASGAQVVLDAKDLRAAWLRALPELLSR